MAAYVIARVEAWDTVWRAESGPKTQALVQKHGGKALAGFGSAVERLEGEGPLQSTIVA